ncbi:M17 family metallopeptidase [Shewanella intestini]|uniref:Leucyl aminopeptidase family protein n=1 Tax=Shewanella intestini TaxID=2017544 RepID=A0ABS5HXM8_9GAMM|nr:MULTISPECIES: leucyl aminopeptidase family protein [Shewanella]MBR9726447.1 leucyl aminopeptidase family protein [Shewanella intestini]MRG34987.1 leucyl aminopeptidase family protein [Shewanella sp. XMDDZSB0408]
MFHSPIKDVSQVDAIFEGSGWDAVVVVTPRLADIPYDEINMLASHAAGIDQRVGQSTTLLFAPGLAGGRLIISPVQQLNDDYVDVRQYAKAARTAIETAQQAGAKQPLLIVCAAETGRFEFAKQVAAIACGQSIWQPLETREANGLTPAFTCIGLLSDTTLSAKVNALTVGQSFARDLCGTEPERMSAIAFANYCETAFKDTVVNCQVVVDKATLLNDYPLLSAVGRSSFDVARHHPRVIKLEYVGEGDIEQSYFFAGKGVVYDTGGADIKVAGGMAGMSRDKGGAAAVAGLMKALSITQPKGVRVVAELGLVRNSIGSDAFVTDEIITSHAGVRVRIGNTDAEGRLVLADLLSHLKGQATSINGKQSKPPQLYSVATLTGHVVRCYGGYSALVENSVAKQQQLANHLEQIGTLWGEPLEVSSLRPDDFDKIADRNGAADVISSNNGPSSVTTRGHQYPAAFLIKAAGLDCHGLQSSTPLAFTHVDIAGSATEGDPLYGKPTANPLVTLFQYICR